MKKRQRKCPNCKAQFTPTNDLQRACGYACAMVIARAKIAKRERKEARLAREKLKTKREWLKDCQVAFNRWVRWRDRDKPCISCGTTESPQWHAGHYISVGMGGANAALRFEPLNCHRQCHKCNTYLSGNIAQYRIRLLQKIGPDAMEWLEGPHPAKHYTTDQLKDIRDQYRDMFKNEQGEP